MRGQRASSLTCATTQFHNKSSRARATARGKCADSQSAKLAGSYAQNSQRSGMAAKRVCRSDGVLQSMCFLHCFSTNNVPGVRRELAACKTLAISSRPLFDMRSLGGLFRAVYDMLLHRFCPAAAQPQLQSRGAAAARCATTFIAAFLRLH